MPLFKVLGKARAKAAPKGRRRKRSGWRTEGDDHVPSLRTLCLMSVADNVKMWVKDYEDNYMGKYSFRYVVGPFNVLSPELMGELTCLLSSRKLLSRSALHLLLLPPLRTLSLSGCPGLATSAICNLIATRCQSLSSLDLSGAQHLTSRVLSETLHSLPVLRCLSLSGTPCDRAVVQTLAQHCPLLVHLDVSRCHFLSPMALLPLAGVSPGCPSCASKAQRPAAASAPFLPRPASWSPSRLRSLLALDIGFGEDEGDAVAAATFLLLFLPSLERVALAGLAQAFSIIWRRDFGQTEEFMRREGAPPLAEVWRARQGARNGGEDEDYDEEEEEEAWRQWCESESDGEDESREEGGRSPVWKGAWPLTLRLRDVRGLHCASLDHVVALCPRLCSLALDFDPESDSGGRTQASQLAADLRPWAGQLRSLSLHFSGSLPSLGPALRLLGPALLSLTLEGLTLGWNVSLWTLMAACPRLRELQIVSAAPPSTLAGRPAEDEDGDRDGDRDGHRHGGAFFLPDLRSLMLNFSGVKEQSRPPSVRLQSSLSALLQASPLLENVSLVALPGPLAQVLCYITVRHLPDLWRRDAALRRVRRLVLARSDVTAATVRCLLEWCRRLEFVDLSHCRHIRQVERQQLQQLADHVKMVWE